jgi:DNA-binding transcriptional LysR family regulator
MELDLKAIQSFAELSADLSFTRAALRLRITQPQLSNRIKHLEERLGFRLVERSSRKVTLNSQGEAFHAQSRRVLQEWAGLRALAEDLRFDVQSSLRIAAVDYFRPIRRRLTEAFTAMHPSVMVEIDSVSRSADAVSALADGRYDAAFLLQADAADLPDNFEALLLARQPVGLIVPGQSALASAPAIEDHHLVDATVAVFRRDLSPWLHDDLMRFLSARAGRIVRLPEAGVEGILDFVAQTGRAVASVRWWDDDRDSPAGVVHRPFVGLPSTMTCLLVRSRDHKSPAGDLLWRLARREVRHLARQARTSQQL